MPEMWPHPRSSSPNVIGSTNSTAPRRAVFTLFSFPHRALCLSHPRREKIMLLDYLELEKELTCSNILFSSQNHVNPAMDFTQTPPGMLALDNMLYFAKHHQDAYIRVSMKCLSAGVGFLLTLNF